MHYGIFAGGGGATGILGGQMPPCAPPGLNPVLLSLGTCARVIYGSCMCVCVCVCVSVTTLAATYQVYNNIMSEVRQFLIVGF